MHAFGSPDTALCTQNLTYFKYSVSAGRMFCGYIPAQTPPLIQGIFLDKILGCLAPTQFRLLHEVQQSGKGINNTQIKPQ